MRIHIIRKKVTADEIKDMLETLNSYIKLAVDIKREVVVGGGILHADCEALINIRPRQNNRSMKIEDKKIRLKVEKIIKKRLSHEKPK